jgi:hypothetical protein
MNTITLPRERCSKSLKFGQTQAKPGRVFRCLLPSGHPGQCRFAERATGRRP